MFTNTTSKKLFGVLLMVFLSFQAFSQKVTINVSNASINSVLNKVQKESGCSVVIKTNDLDLSKKVSVSANNKDAATVIRDLFAQSGQNVNVSVDGTTLSVSSVKNFTIAGSGNVNKTVKGKVIDKKSSEPVIGASVFQKGTNNGVVVGLDGNFSINVPEGATLVISSIGYLTIESVVGSQSAMNFAMEVDALGLEEAVVVGYGTSLKRDLIASVSTVKTSEISNLPTTNIAQGLAGRSAGLIVVESTSGINTTPTISIRGGGTPLFVIDGVVRSASDFNTLTAEEIESMSILKDASAAAVYGSRASNGIIQIVTKSGSANSGRPKLEYDLAYSISQPTNWPDTYDSYDRAIWTNTARVNDGLEEQYDENALNLILSGEDPFTYGNWNAKKMLLNKWAPQTKHTARISGGNDKHHYFASIGNTDQHSLYKSDAYWMKRTNFRLSETADFTKIGLHVTAALDGYQETVNHPCSWASSSYSSAMGRIIAWNTFTPFLNKYGYILEGGDNPASETSGDGGYTRTVRDVLNGRGEILWDCLWVEGLKVRLSADYRYGASDNKTWTMDPPRYAWDSQTQSTTNNPKLTYSHTRGTAYTTQAFLEYANTFGKHSISALGGYERYYEFSTSYSTTRENFRYDIDQMSIGDANTTTNSGSEAELGRAAWVGSAKYNYAGKYYVEGNLRYDGSDYFAPGKRWGLFFSGALGWVVSEEPFMRELKQRNIFNTLKLRASYGETGLDSSAGRFAYLTSYTLTAKSLVVDDEYTQGLSEGALASPDLTWYSTRQTDIGFDFASLAGKLYGSFDYFYNSTTGYLVTPTGQSYINTALGVSMPKVKSESEYRRAGTEFQLGYKNNIGDFRYDITGTFTYYDQMWAYNQSESESSYMNPYTRTQQQKGYYSTMYHTLGYYADAEDVMNSAAYISAIKSGYLSAGDLKYEDTNGDGQITSADYRRLGKNSFPRGQFGLNVNLGYKNFYLSVLLQGTTAVDMYSNYYNTQNSPVVYDWQTDTWTPDNTDAMLPRLTSNRSLNSSNSGLTSDFWLINGAYLRLKDFQFGYDFKGKLLTNVKWISKLKAGISGQNIFTISEAVKYGMDPETGRTYPGMRTFAFTLNVGF